MRCKGKITTWNDDRGFGFVTPLNGGAQVFIHISAFGHRSRRPEVNDIVTFAFAEDKQGRPCAASATLAGDRLEPRTAKPASRPAILLASIFLAVVGISVAFGGLPAIVGIVYAILSPTAFVAYALDKSAARKGAWRTPESTLHLLGLAGGWPGALIAQETLRHKSQKGSFRIVFWGTALINCAAVIWLHSDDGRVLTNALLAGGL